MPSLKDLPPPPPGRNGWPWTEDAPVVPETLPDGSPWPLISVTTPSYNQGRYLEETIRSVLLQGYPNLEYFVYDGGSTDNSVEIIRQYERWITGWVSERDRGQGDAINKGFARSTGEFVAWINSDDFLYPGFLSKMATALRSRPDVGLVYGDVETCWKDEPKRARRSGKATTFEDVLRTLKIPIPQQSCMWRRSVVESIGPLEPRWHVTLDREYLLRTCLNCKFEYLPGAVALFRYHGGSIAMSQQRKWLTEIPQLYREFFQKPELPAHLRSLRAETMSSAYLYCARMAMRCNARISAVGFATRAFFAYPRLLFRYNDFYQALWKRLRGSAVL